jgi:hypothetical protein
MPRWGEDPRMSDGVELRVFHAAGYDSRNVDGRVALDAAAQARLDFGKTRILILIDWSSCDQDGRARDVWRWERGSEN